MSLLHRRHRIGLKDCCMSGEPFQHERWCRWFSEYERDLARRTLR